MTEATPPKPNPSELHPLARIANLEAKVAQLDQRIAKLESTQTSLISSLSSTPASILENLPDDNLFEIVSIDTRIIEASESWSKVAWKLVVQSLSNISIAFHASIEFLDRDGFIVDDTIEPNLLLPAKNQQTYTGYTLIDAPLMENISSIRAKLKLL